jgi:hypothetical protein
MKLVHNSTGEEVKVGDKVTSFRGEVEKVTFFREPRSAASQGHIVTKAGEYYCSVYDCKWIEREDRK